MAQSISQRLDKTRHVRDAVLALLEGRAVENHNSYSVNDRSISKMTLAELTEAYKYLNGEVRRLEKEFNRARGRSSVARFRF